MEIARVFLGKDRISAYPADKIEKLKTALGEFIIVNRTALTKNKMNLDPLQVEFHNQCEVSYTTMKKEMTDLVYYNFLLH